MSNSELETQATLRHWRETIPNDRLAHLVKDAARCFARGLQLRLATHQVSFGHWVFLRILWEEDGLTQRALSERAGLMEPTTFSALKAMEELGYIRRATIPGNRKSVSIQLTDVGRDLKMALVPLAEEVNNIATGRIPPEDLAATRRTLLAIIQNLAADELEAVARNQRIPPKRAARRNKEGV